MNCGKWCDRLFIIAVSVPLFGISSSFAVTLTIEFLFVVVLLLLWDRKSKKYVHLN